MNEQLLLRTIRQLREALRNVAENDGDDFSLDEAQDALSKTKWIDDSEDDDDDDDSVE